MDGQGAWVHLAAPMEHINVHIRGGSVIPMQPPSVTTTASRLNPFEILVALSSADSARGEVFLDDGDRLDVLEAHAYSLVQFKLEKNVLSSRVVSSGYTGSPLLDTVTVYGMKQPKEVLVGNKKVNFSYNDIGVLRVERLALNLTAEFKITFQF